MSRKSSKSKNKTRHLLETEVHPDAAGIDIGAEELVVAIDPVRDDEPVRTFQTFTADLHRLKDWLLSCQITTVAMESTGNYWIAAYQILEDAGIEVFLVNARHVKAVPGRKTDVCDAQWLQKLHAAGLLRSSFRPQREIIPLRYLMRHRCGLVRESSRQIQRMQKVLTEMNLKLHHVFSDLDGTSAQRIIRAILEGGRDSDALWQLRDPRCRATKQTFLAAIEGDWREEYLFVLQQCQDHWTHMRTMIAKCDEKIQLLIEQIDSSDEQGKHQEEQRPTTTSRTRKVAKNDLGFDIHSESLRFYGVDLTSIDGVSTGTLGVLMSEIGTRDQLLEAFPSASRFCSWLTLCPDNRISGGKILGSKTRQSANRVAACLRMAAQALTRAKSALGEYCRRMKARLGKAEGTTAVAHKLARIIYAMLKSLTPYNETNCFQVTGKHRERKLSNLKNAAKKLGFELTPLPDATP